MVRVDPDVVLDERAFVLTHRWFRDPSVGAVRALPRPVGGNAWLRRMRWFECLGGTGSHRAYVAYRREVAERVTDGLHRDDADQAIRRAGFRVVLDPAIRVWERAPATMGEFRGQRIRWSQAGLGEPAWRTRLFALPTLDLAGILVTLYAAELAVLGPAYRPGITAETALLGFGAAAAISLLIALSMAFDWASDLGWLATWWLYALARRVFALEGMLALTTRSVRLARATVRSSSTSSFEGQLDLEAPRPAVVPSVRLTASAGGKAVLIDESPPSVPPGRIERAFVAAPARQIRAHPRNPAILAAVDLRSASPRSPTHP